MERIDRHENGKHYVDYINPDGSKTTLVSMYNPFFDKAETKKEQATAKAILLDFNKDVEDRDKQE